MKYEKIEGVPCIVEHQITILVQDAPMTYNYYDESEVAKILKRLKALDKKYELKSALYPIH